MLANNALRSIAPNVGITPKAEPIENVVCLTDTGGEDNKAEEMHA